MSSLVDIQKRLMSDELIAHIRAKASTPVLLGGYDTRYFHSNLYVEEPIRTSSIKGLWRWWARSLLNAAISEEDDICAKSIVIKDLDTLIGMILGSRDERSKYQIVTEILSREGKSRVYEEITDVPRVKLAKLNEHFLLSGVTFNIDIYRNGFALKEEDEFAATSLIMALIFDGIGKATSRGFGRLKFERIESKILSIELKKIISGIFSPSNYEELERSIIKLINEGVKIARKILQQERISEQMKRICEEVKQKRSSEEIGIFPLIETANLNKDFMTVKVLSKNFHDYISVLRAIGNASLKQYHKAYKISKDVEEDFRKALKRVENERGHEIHTWLLGLPRAQEPPIIKPPTNYLNKRLSEIRYKLEKKLRDSLKSYNESLLSNIVKEFTSKISKKGNAIKIPTGYYFVDLKERRVIEIRRKSPIRFAVIETASHSYWVVAYMFKTSDWVELLFNEGLLLHIGADYIRKNGRIINIREFFVTPIKMGYSDLLSNLNEIFKVTNDLISKSLAEVRK